MFFRSIRYDLLIKLNLQRLSAGLPTSVVFVDGNNNESFPRLIEFMQKRCFTEVPTHIQKLAEVSLLKRLSV